MDTERINDQTMSFLIEQHLMMLRAEEMSPRTIRDRGRCLRRLHDDLPHGIAYACREQIIEWLAYEHWSRWTRYTYAGHVFEFFHWLSREYPDVMTDDPTAGLRRPKAPSSRPRPATDEQLALALTAPEPILTAVILANYAGMRRAEIAGCWREHITPEAILIPRAKGGDVQMVPCHPAIWDHVWDRPGGPLVTNPRGEAMEPERLGRVVHDWCRRVGLKGWGLHQLRHRYGTLIQRRWGDIRVTQECLRHQSIRSTQIYTEVTEQQRQRAIEALPWWKHRADGSRPVPPADAA